MARALRFDDETSRWALPAGLVSIVAHVCLLWAIGASTRWIPAEEPLSPLRFVGQTFDVDALGEDNQDEAQPQGSESDPSHAAPFEETTPEEANAPEEDPPEAEPEDESRNEPALITDTPAPPHNPVKPQESERPKEEAKTPPVPARPSKKPVDPFDLGVPGDSSSSAAPQTPSDTGSYGAEGSDAPVTDVFKAFLHLFPEANRHNPAFHELPLGPVGRIEFSLMIGKNARLVSIEVHDDGKTPPPKLLIDAVRKTQTYLSHQRLGWEGERREGSERLALTLRAEQRAPHATTPDREGTQRHGRYGEARPTGAFFTYYDGRHIDIELVRVVDDAESL